MRWRYGGSQPLQGDPVHRGAVRIYVRNHNQIALVSRHTMSKVTALASANAVILFNVRIIRQYESSSQKICTWGGQLTLETILHLYPLFNTRSLINDLPD